MRTFFYRIPPSYDGVSLEQYLRSAHGYSGRILTRLKKRPEYVHYNGAHLRLVDPVETGGEVRIILEDIPHTLPNPMLSVPIVYEDDDLIVFDKPAGMPVHPSRNHAADTLGNFFAAYCEQTGQKLVFRPVTRLDADTTGLCVVAKNMLSCSKLSGQIEKEYLALVSTDRLIDAQEPDLLLEGAGTIDAPIARENGDGIRRCVDAVYGKRAVTHFSVLDRGIKVTLVRVWTETGRTHQIRVHFAYIGHPLVGDSWYGGDCSEVCTHQLHCNMVRFMHPTTGKSVCLCSKIEKYANIFA